MDLAWICASLSRFLEMSVLWKTSIFSIFSWPHRKNFQVAANRTILKIDAFHIAHFEADVPNFSKHLWNLAIPRKLWVPAHSEVRWSGTMTAKMSVFLPLFGRKWFVSPNWPHESPPPSVIHGWKATDLLYEMVRRKNYWRNPISRQNFANALAENHNLKLEVCLIAFEHWSLPIQKH